MEKFFEDLPDPQWQSGKPARRVNGIGRRLVRYPLNPGGAFEKFLQDDPQLHSGQRSARADVNARAVKEILAGIAVQSESFRVLKGAGVAVGRDPDQRDSLAGIDLLAADFHRTGRDAPVGNQRSVDPENLIDRSRQRGGLGAQLLLQLRVLRKIVDQDADRCGNGANLPDGPVPQNAGNLLVAQRPSRDVFVHQGGSDVVLGLCFGLPTRLKHRFDKTLELAGNFRHDLPVLSEGRLVVFFGPADQWFVQGRWPAEKGGLHTRSEGKSKGGHQLDLAARELVPHQLRDDFPARRLEGIHPFLGKIRKKPNHKTTSNQNQRKRGKWRDDAPALKPKNIHTKSRWFGEPCLGFSF